MFMFFAVTFLYLTGLFQGMDMADHKNSWWIPCWIIAGIFLALEVFYA